MPRDKRVNEPDGDAMRQRRIALPDGRYLIFYTFADASPADDELAGESAKSARAEPSPVPVAEEEEHDGV